MTIIAEGKTKIIEYVGKQRVHIKNKDRVTAGDGAKADSFENKGIYATTTTCNIFELLKRRRIRNHYIKRINSNTFLAHQLRMLPLEVVARRFADGSELKRNPEMAKGTRFDPLRIQFFLKDDDAEPEERDPIIEFQKNKWVLYPPKVPTREAQPIRSMPPMLSSSDIQLIEGLASKTFLALEFVFGQFDMKLWDDKIECGIRLKDGKIVVGDVVDADSFRITDSCGNQLDKQVYRDGGDLETVGVIYRYVAELTEQFGEIALPNRL